MELRDYLRILHKSWILIVACVLAGVAVAAAYCVVVTPQYEAKTGLYVSVKSSDSQGTSELVQGSSFAQQAVTSYVNVASSAIVLDRVIKDLGLETTVEDLSKNVAASSPLNTVLIDITVTDPSPKKAAKIANSVGENLAKVVSDDLVKPSGGGGASLVKISTINPALVPDSPSSPRVALALALGLLVGLAVGIAAAVLRSVLDTRIHSAHDIEQVTESPILGAISFDPDAKRRPLIVHVDPRNPRAESFRSLRTNLQFVNIGEGPRSYVVTSSVPGEGKSTTSANLAISLAETGAKVALIDGDLRMPKIAEYMGIEGAVGLTDVLIGRVELSDVLQRWGRGHLFVLPSGRIPPNPSELLGSKAMAGVLRSLTAEFDYVIVDAPPLLLVTDAAVVSKLTGGAILTAASGRTKSAELQAAVRALDHIGSRLMGVIVTMLPTRGPDSYSYGVYGYGVQHDVVDDDGALPASGGRRRSTGVGPA